MTSKKSSPTKVKIKILTDDKVGALRRISNIFTSLGINIEKTSARKRFFSKKFICKFTLTIKNPKALIRFFEENEEIKKHINLLGKTGI